nr:hypothetical protein [Tanacetum cinerariifolium]
ANGKDPSKQVALDLVRFAGLRRRLKKNKKMTKSNQNRTKAGSVEKPSSAQGQSQSRKQKKEENTSSKDQKMQVLESVFNQEQRQGLKLQFIQRCSQGGVSTKGAKLFKEGTTQAITSITLEGLLCTSPKVKTHMDCQC